MENFSTRMSEAIKEQQMAQLSISLSSLRVAGKSDTIIVCEGREFPTHKLILEASSPYFETMFHSGLTEAQSGKIVFRDMKAETIEAILDFIYLGKVGKIQTFDQLKETLKVAHMMQLENLFLYCCKLLLTKLSINNFCDVWEIAVLYNRDTIMEPLLEYMFSHRFEILSTKKFCHLTTNHMREYLQFSRTKNLCMNEVLGGFVKWLLADVNERKLFANELLECIGFELVTQQYICNLVNDKDLMASSADIAISLRMFYGSFLMWLSEGNCVTPVALNCGKASIVFFSESRCEKYGDKACKNNCWPICIQQFDVQNMTWLPAKVVGESLQNAAVAQNKQYVYAAGGGLGKIGLMYNTSNGSVEFTNWCAFQGTVNAGLGFFGNIVFLVERENSLRYIYSMSGDSLQKPKNSKTRSVLEYSSSSPILLSTKDCMFIISSDIHIVIQFAYIRNTPLEVVEWKVLQFPCRSVPLFLRHFFIAKDTLQGIIVDNDVLIKVKFNKATQRLESNQFPCQCPDNKPVVRVYQFPNNDSSLVFVSTIEKGPAIPNYLWEPQSNKWTKLPPLQGRCSFPSCGIVYHQKYVVEI